MQQSKKINSIQFLQWPIKIVIASLAVWFIYKSVFEKSSMDELLSSSYSTLLAYESIYLSSTIILLMLINWSLEAWKWKLMISKVESVGFLRALEAVFSGLTVSFFTPNRTGEFAGRIFQLKSADRIKASLITIIENSSQLIITIFTGSVGLIFYLIHYTDINAYWLVAGVVISITIAIVSVFLYLNIYLLENFLDRFRFLKKFHPYIEVFAFYSTRELIQVLLISVLRFFVFSLQFYLLLHVFGISLPYLPALLMITMIFYVMTLVPTFFITELAVRGSVAIAFLGTLSEDNAGIISSTISLWLINLVIPALIGAFCVFTFRFRKYKTA